jgi:hypothetical protein
VAQHHTTVARSPVDELELSTGLRSYPQLAGKPYSSGSLLASFSRSAIA